MNIKITHNWLLEYLDTNATPYDIQRCLSLCGPSIEKVEKIGNDYVYEIEITTNRVDTASVIGIAKEASAILPQFGFKAKLKTINPLIPQVADRFNLIIEDKNKLCKRILAVVMDNVTVKPSPSYIKERLENCDIRSLNNLVDITNYVMLEIGHPTHVFDYDRIKSHKLILRHAQDKEEIITLDDKKYNLCEDDIVIDDGTGKVIDLPGIMGTTNSVVTSETKRVIFFIESNDPVAIRKSSMKYGIRTMAATINEKSPDPELAKIALLRGIELFQKIVTGKVASPIYDVYTNPYKQKTVSISFEDINKIIGVKISEKKIIQILSSLGFQNHLEDDRTKMDLLVPSYRDKDVSIKEDIIEEIARVYGYHNLPNNFQPPAYVSQPKETEKMLEYQSKIKYFLKHLGLIEIMNYSMTSREMIEMFDLKIGDHLKVKNSISEEIEYMRTHLTPSLVKNIKDNEGKKDELKLFEIAKIYKKSNNDLPVEKYKIGIVVNTSFFELKGVIEALLQELNINQYEIKLGDNPVMSNTNQGQIIINGKKIGAFGQLKSDYKLRIKSKSNIFLCVLDFDLLITHARLLPKYKSINPYAIIKLDLTTNSKRTFEEIKRLSFESSKYLQKVEFLNIFENKISLRFYFSSTVKNLTEEEAILEMNKITNLI